MLRHALVSLGLVGLALSAAGSAAAHITLIAINGQTDVARVEGETGDPQLKIAPCGQSGNTRTQKVTTLTAGAQATITWDEYIDHPGFFRIAFDPDGADNFPVIAGMDTKTAGFDPAIENPVGDVVLAYVEDGMTSASFTVPNVTCSNCTLQLIQFMEDKLGDGADDEIYYQCADIEITAGGASAGGTGGAGGATGGTAGGTAGGTGGQTAGGQTAGGTGGTLTAHAGTGGQVVAAGGTANAGTSTGGTVAAAGAVAAAGGTAPVASSDSGGCAMAGGSHNAPTALFALSLSALLLVFRRRR